MINIDNAVKKYVEGILELLEKDNNWKKTIVIWQPLYNNSSLRFFDNKNEFYSPITKESNPNNIIIGDKMITEYFHNCQSAPNLRWNKGTLTIYPNGEYESSFIWDEVADLENLALAVWQTIDYWGNEFLFNYLYEFYPDWQKAVVKTYIKDNKVIFQLISLNEKAILVGIEIPEQMQTDYIAWQEYCVNGKVKPLFTPWNGIILVTV